MNLWVSSRTARSLERLLGGLTKQILSKAILDVADSMAVVPDEADTEVEVAVPIPVSKKAFEVFCSTWAGVSDEHRAQLLVEALHLAGYH